MTQGVQVFDLKIGTGTKVAADDLVELHYEVAEAPDQLDGVAYIQSSWIRNRPLRVRVGRGQLRKEVDQALFGVAVGTDRRLIVSPGHWADAPRGVAIAIYVQSVLPVPAAGERDDRSGVNWIALPDEDDVSGQWQVIIAAIREVQRGNSRKGQLTGRARLKRQELDALMTEAARARELGMIQYNLREVSESAGLVEFEMARNDAEALEYYLLREYGAPGMKGQPGSRG